MEFSWRRRTNSKKFVLIAVLLGISLSLVMVSLQMLIAVHKKPQLKTFQDANYYELYDSLSGDTMEAFQEEKDNLLRLREFHEQLKSETRFQFLDLFMQKIYIQDFTDRDVFLYGYEENQNIQKDMTITYGEKPFSAFKCVQMEAAGFQHFNLAFSSKDSRLFHHWDTYGEACIPIVLGSEYRDVIQLGGEYSMLYLNKAMNIKVMGFLEANSAVYAGGRLIYLDRFILMPSLNPQLPATQEEKTFQLQLYQQKLHGLIFTDLSANETQLIVQDLSVKTQLPLFFVSGASNAIEIFNLETNQFTGLLLTVSLSLTVLSSIGLALAILIKLKEDLEIYAIHLLCGAKLSDIRGSLIAGVSTLVIFSFSLSALVTSLLAKLSLLTLCIVLSLCLLICAASLAAPIYKLNHMSIRDLIKREE